MFYSALAVPECSFGHTQKNRRKGNRVCYAKNCSLKTRNTVLEAFLLYLRLFVNVKTEQIGQQSTLVAGIDRAAYEANYVQRTQYVIECIASMLNHKAVRASRGR